MRETINDAERILARLRQAAEALAEVSYLNASWGNRMATPPIAQKQAILNRVNEQLRGLGVPEDEIKGLAKDYLKFIGFDLAWHFRMVAVERVRIRMNEAVAKAGQGDMAFIKPRNDFIHQSEPIILDENILDLASVLKRQTPEGLLPPEDITKLHEFATKNVSVFQKCVSAGAVTPDALPFIERYVNDSGGRLAYTDVFGVDPPG